MKLQLHLSAFVAALVLGPAVHAATVNVGDSTAPWTGFMNVFELPANGGGFVFASSWGVPDLNTSFDNGAHTLTISPNTVGDPNPFWYTPSGGPGAQGNKIMEANLYQEVSDGSLSGQTVTFEGSVLSNTYTSAHTGSIFIRDFAPDYSSFSQSIITITSPGPFSISLNTASGAGRHVQFGFQSRGVNVWATDVAPFGNVVIATVPAPAAGVLFLCGAPIALRRRR